MGDCERDRLQNGTVIHEDLVDLTRRDLLTATIDDSFEAAADMKITFTISDLLFRQFLLPTLAQ